MQGVQSLTIKNCNGRTWVQAGSYVTLCGIGHRQLPGCCGIYLFHDVLLFDVVYTPVMWELMGLIMNKRGESYAMISDSVENPVFRDKQDYWVKTELGLNHNSGNTIATYHAPRCAVVRPLLNGELAIAKWSKDYEIYLRK